MRWTVLIPTGLVTLLALATTSHPAAQAQPRGPARAAGAARGPQGSKADLTALRRDLSGEDAARAIAAAGVLGKTQPDPAALAVLLDALALGLEPTVATAALDAVAAHRSKDALDTVEFFLHYRDARVRAAAVRAMGAVDEPRAVAHVLAALSDMDEPVRAAAVAVVAERDLRRAIEPMLELLKKGDEATVPALARLADADLARALGEFIGVAPDFLLARTLGLILLRKDFGPEAARVQVVRALGKVPGPEVVEQLTKYVESIPANPPRQSRREAEALIEARVTEGK